MLVPCSLFSCQPTARRHPERLTLSRRPNPGSPSWSAEGSRVRCWKRRTGQMPGGGTVWSVRMQPLTECCFRADTPVCVTAACHTFSTVPCAEPSLWSLLPWQRLQYGHQTKPGHVIIFSKTLTPENVFEWIYIYLHFWCAFTIFWFCCSAFICSHVLRPLCCGKRPHHSSFSPASLFPWF